MRLAEDKWRISHIHIIIFLVFNLFLGIKTFFFFAFIYPERKATPIHIYSQQTLFIALTKRGKHFFLSRM